jgi:hypothetical protein
MFNGVPSGIPLYPLFGGFIKKLKDMASTENIEQAIIY